MPPGPVASRPRARGRNSRGWRGCAAPIARQGRRRHCPRPPSGSSPGARRRRGRGPIAPAGR
eukprot:1260681-Pyramimonas_sp.AAC.1